MRDEIDLPGSGLVAFASFAFDSGGEEVSLVIVPKRRRGETRRSMVRDDRGRRRSPVAASLVPTDAPDSPRDVVFADGSRSGTDWTTAVAEAVRRIGAGDLEKVVLARDLIAESASSLDVRWPLTRLAEDYDGCWTFLVDGLLGATPEMLVRLEKDLVTSRVLAGTIRRTGDDVHDLALAASLARSSKDLEEHEYAVRSVADALAPHCSPMNVPEAPFVLHLPNVMHLATDVTGVVRDGSTALGLAAALHPSAAVCGTPTEVALDTIRDLEGMDRGRYAGPVGWIGADGDGELGHRPPVRPRARARG